MILYVVKARSFKTAGALYYRGEVLLPSVIKNAPIKVSDGKIIKIDTENPRWTRQLRTVGCKIGMNLVPRVKAKIAQIEAEEMLVEEQKKEAIAVAAVEAATQAKVQEQVQADVAAILAKAQAAATKNSTVK